MTSLEVTIFNSLMMLRNFIRYETETHLGIRTKPNKVQLSYKDIDVKKLKKKLIEKREQKEKNKQELEKVLQI